LVADAISENVKDRGLTEEGLLKSVGFLKTTTLLLALCVENSFKGVKAANKLFKVDAKGSLERKTRGGGASGHSLIKLAEEIEFSLSESEITLLDRLSEIGIWAGKYHVPIHENAFVKMCQDNPKLLKLPSDLHLVKNILNRATKLAKVPAVLS